MSARTTAGEAIRVPPGAVATSGPQAAAWSVEDDGIGMSDPPAPAGDGLVGMRDRIGAAGGELWISSAQGRGTSVSGSIPASRLAAAAGSW